jgi:hypothetical protein
LCNPRHGLSIDRTHLAPVASLAGSCGRLQLLLDSIREFLGMLSFNLLGRSPVGLSRARSFLRHLADNSPKCAGRSRGVEGRSRSIFKPSSLGFWELRTKSDNANVLDWRCRIQREGVVLLFDAFLRVLRRITMKCHP